MQHFYYSFVLTLFHSLWQTLLLLMGYQAILLLNKNTPPLFKRNLLFSLLALQIVISLGSFFIIHFSTGFLSLKSLLPLPQNFNASAQWPIWLFTGYLFLLGFKTGNLFRSYNRLQLLKKESFLKVSPELKIFTKQKAFLLGIKRPVTIAFHKNITTPLTYGFLKPVILLPFSLCNSISIAAAETLVLHELTHIKNKDYLLNLFLPWIENIFFFNPFIQLIIKDIRLEREKSCDWQVLQFNYEPITYAEILLQTARHPQTKQNLFLAAVSKPSQLLTRIQFFSNQRNLSAGKAPKSWLVAPFFLLTALVSLSVLMSKKEELKNEIITNLTSSFNYAYDTPPVPIEVVPEFTDFPLAVKPNLFKEQNNSLAHVENPEPEILNEVAANPTLIIDSLSLAIQPYEMIPIKFIEADSLFSREVTVTEEHSGGEKVTKTYLVKLVKGEWQAAPLWMIKEVPAKTDSLKTNLKDSLAPLQIIVLKDSLKEL